MASSSTLIDLPMELLQRVLTHCHPRDVAGFSQTCREAYNLIYLTTDQYLWRQLYLAYPFDHPEIVASQRLDAGVSSKVKPVSGDEVDGLNYRNRLTDLVNAERAASKGPRTVEEEKNTLLVFQRVLTQLPITSRTEDGEVQPSLNADWLERTLDEESALLTSEPDPSLSTPKPGAFSEVEGIRARLRCSVLSSFKQSGTNPDLALSKEDYSFFVAKRNRSRCFVYDLRNYTARTHWGPFTPDNHVNWVHVEYLMNVVWMNLCDPPITNMPRPRIGTEAFRPHSSGGDYSQEDWAGVEGVWSRYVCFMDYRDLFSFNVPYAEDDGPLDEGFFAESTFREATRLLEVKLKIVDRSILNGIGFVLHRKYSANPHRPPLYFKGTSRGSDGAAASIIKGCVYEEEDGSIRWRFESIYDNSPQWSSSGVQIGDVGSAVGVIGVWTTTSHDQSDPVGPFWLFKNQDGTPTQVMDFN
ncbi:hypothetical protein D9611_003456 [Ephemerocybe angulata]|uniref:F-box domain-containing protein n=1 Tax=Ephemerocybe angulata TaxID=980116 RepID=A0A8H5C9H3_9AGAR|nr:hypothetical protein D9611_003456 [Tulosesus angulatus]